MESLTTKEEPSKYYYYYGAFINHVKMIKEWVKREDHSPDVILSVNRGGLVPGVYLSHALNVPHYPIQYQSRDKDDQFLTPPIYNRSFKNKNIILVDDINDSGHTFTHIMGLLGSRMNLSPANLNQHIKTVSLVERSGSKWAVDYSPWTLDTNDWVVFPWEITSIGRWWENKSETV